MIDSRVLRQYEIIADVLNLNIILNLNPDVARKDYWIRSFSIPCRLNWRDRFPWILRQLSFSIPFSPGSHCVCLSSAAGGHEAFGLLSSDSHWRATFDADCLLTLSCCLTASESPDNRRSSCRAARDVPGKRKLVYFEGKIQYFFSLIIHSQGSIIATQ